MLHQNSSPWKTIKSTLISSSDIYSLNNKTPEKLQQHELYSENGSPLPSTFKFTPTRGRKLYPHLNPPDKNLLLSNINSSPIHDNSNNYKNNININNDYDESYLNKENSSFISAMDNLGKQLFSSNISNKVMNEFSSRYEKVREESIINVQELNNTTSNDELNRRASGRFSSSHKNRFNRMESIAFHYAAKRSKALENNSSPNKDDLKFSKSNTIQRKLIPKNESIELNNNTILTPGDKRFVIKPLESASKRLKVDQNNFKEIDSSPTKSLYEKEQLKNIYNNNNNINIPSYLQPTKASLCKSTSNRQISPSKSTRSISNNLGFGIETPILKPQEATISRGISRSPSISPTRSLLASKNSSPSSKISPSKAFSNLNKILNTPPQTSSSITNNNQNKEIPPLINDNKDNSLPKTRIPRSKTLGPLNKNNDKTSIPRSKTSNLSYSKSHIASASTNNIRTLSGSSSIPRLAKLATTESRIRQVSKHDSDNDNNNKHLKPWR